MEGAPTVLIFVIRVMIYFFTLETLMGRHATCFAESGDTNEDTVVLSRSDRDGAPYQYGMYIDDSQAKEREQANLHWVMVTAETLSLTAKFLQDVGPQELFSTQIQQRFSDHLYCQTDGVNGPYEMNDHPGENIVQHLIKTVIDINTNGDAEELQVTESKFACYIDVLNGVYEVDHESTSDVDQDIQKDFDTAQILLQNKIEELEHRRSYLEKPYEIPRERREANLVITTTSTSNDISLREDNVDYSSLSSEELYQLLSTESFSLHLCLIQLATLEEVDRVETMAISFTNDAVSFWKDLIEMITQKLPTSNSIGHVQITHGPYCDGMIKTGTILELFWDMMEDAVTHTLAVEHAKDNETLTEAIEEASCRISAFGSIVLISSDKMNLTEFYEVSQALVVTLLDLVTMEERLQERSNETKMELQDLEQQTSSLRLRLTKIRKEIHPRSLQSGQLKGKVKVFVDQQVGVQN